MDYAENRPDVTSFSGQSLLGPRLAGCAENVYNHVVNSVPPKPAEATLPQPFIPALHWIFRAGVLMCFVGHGAFGIITRPAWFPYFAVVAITAAAALRLEPLIGVHDISLGVFTFLSPRPIVLLWAGIWCTWTALLRPLAGEGWWEFLERAGNYGVPLAFLLLHGWPRSRRAWFETIRPAPVPPEILGRVAGVLRWTTGLLLIGHGGFGALQHKPMLADMYTHAGLPAIPWGHPSLETSIGLFELLLGVAILLRPMGVLLLFACVWKIASELLYPATGSPWWEFVERGGSYTAPFLLFLVQRMRAREARRERILPAYTPAMMLLGVAFLIGVPASAAGGLTDEDTARVDIHFTASADTALVRMLRGGGYILAFRHGSTDWNQRDSDVLNYADRSTQRNLSDRGRADATNIGKAIAALGIPIGEVRSSPFWRCRDTAVLAFGRADTTSALFTKSHTYRRLRWSMLSTPPRKGTNTVFVTHQDALMPLTTLARDQLKEGDALVIEPLGKGGFRAVAQLAPGDWDRLVHAAAGKSPE